MKKIVSIFLIVIFLASSISWADDSTQGGTSAFCPDGTPPINGLCSDPSTTCDPACDTSTQICDGGTCVAKSQDQGACPGSPGCPGYQESTATSCGTYNNKRTTSTETANCGQGYAKDGFSTQAGTFWCCKPVDATPTDSPGAMGIECDQTQLVNGQCKFNIYDTLGIRKSVRNSGDPTSVGLFVQDIILSATFFIGTLVTVALIVSGLMYIFAASSGKDPADARKGIIGSLLGLLIVVSSYVIIRLVQYIAKGF